MLPYYKLWFLVQVSFVSQKYGNFLACKSDNIIVTSFFARGIRKNKACNSDNTIATRFFVKRHQAARWSKSPRRSQQERCCKRKAEFCVIWHEHIRGAPSRTPNTQPGRSTGWDLIQVPLRSGQGPWVSVGSRGICWFPLLSGLPVSPPSWVVLRPWLSSNLW